MQEKRIKIGVIISSTSMADHIKSLRHDPRYDLRLSVSGLEEAIPVGETMQREGVEVIVSHTGTSNILQEHLEIPVISVPHSSLDLLSATKEAAALGGQILIPNFIEKLSNIDIIRQLFPVKIKQGVYHDSVSLNDLIGRSREDGCDVVIGGGLGASFARKHGMKGIEIKASAEAINTTLASAVSVALSNRQEKARMRRLYSIIDSVAEGIVSVDQDGVIMTVNTQARQMLNFGNRDITGTDYRDHLPWGLYRRVLDTQAPIVDRVERINGKLYLFNYSPVFLQNEVVGCISTFQNASKIMRSENKVRRSLTKGLVAKYTVNDLIWSSNAMGRVIDTVKKFAPTDGTVLISGETGTGKEIVAHGIHNLSKRKKKPFVSINCAALPEQLLESELFGYEGGAFTGSRKSGKPGLFEMAHKGTILLDEISATSPKVQTLMLRVLQEKEVMRLGGDRLIPVDVRVIANTNQELNEEVISGSFREDLYFRLNVLQINVLPLSKRREDIPVLIENFTTSLSHRYKLAPLIIPAPFMEKLIAYDWPGNVRQLINFAEQAVLLCQSRFNPEIFENLYHRLKKYSPNQQERTAAGQDETSSNTCEYPDAKINNFRHEIREKTQAHEVYLIRSALEKTNHNKCKAAALLGISRTTLYKKINQLKL